MHNMKKQALISCSDKSGVVEFAKALTELGYHILSTGGTAKLIAQAGIPVQEVADYTGFPEMLDGRVKTLNPKIHAGILARRPVAEHMEALKQFEIDPIDIVAVNLYPFEQAIANPNCTFENAIENIDIGGFALLRRTMKASPLLFLPATTEKSSKKSKKRATFLLKPDWNWQRKCSFIPLTMTP